MGKAEPIAAVIALMLATLIATPAAARPAAKGGPDLSACGPYRPEEGDPELQRTSPLPIPPALRGVAAASTDYIAVATLSGATLCVFTREMESIDPPTLSADGRFLDFEWSGYEAGGHILVDRSGRGTQAETGAQPVASPRGTRFASVEWSASGFGSLNGVLVLDAGPDGLVELARFGDLPDGDDWRIDRWAGEDCFVISSLPWETSGGETSPDQMPCRQQAVRAGSDGWTLGAAGSGCPAS